MVQRVVDAAAGAASIYQKRGMQFTMSALKRNISPFPAAAASTPAASATI